MRVVITAVGHRAEHWLDLFGLLAGRPRLQLTFVLADVSPAAELTLRELARRHPNVTVVAARHLMSERHSGHVGTVVFAPGALRRAVTERPDVIHVIGEAAYFSTRQVLAWRHRQWPDAPVTLCPAQNVVMDFPAPFSTLERRAHAEVAHALPLTPAAAEVLRHRGYAGPATVVPLGVETNRFTPGAHAGPPREFTAGFVGRLEGQHGIADLLGAAERADAHLLIVGRGSLRSEVDAAARRRPGRIEVVDWIDHDDLPSVLHRMDVLVVPSVEIPTHHLLPWMGIPLQEQFGRAILEAMACGLPVIGNDIGEMGQVLGDAGLLCPPGDVGALAAALVQLRCDRELAHRLGRIGYRRARSEFSWDRIATRLVDVWRQVLGDRPVAAARPAYDAS